MKTLNQIMRDQTAKAKKHIHGALLHVETLDNSPSDFNLLPNALWVIGSIIGCAILLFSCSVTPAHAYTNEQLANAIYQAEGINSKYPYGIRSVSCESKESCRKVCLRTIKNNRIRYSQDARRRSETFLSYLQGVYAPYQAENDSQGTNRNWLKNVEYFLSKEQA